MAETVSVQVSQGGLRGRKVATETGKTYYSFQGIPYAKPPVGALRFKAPQPADAWEGIRDAITEGAVAPQVAEIIGTGYAGEEDCLFLNVYTPQLPKDTAETLKPVMFWIHGGGFYMGFSNTSFYGPDYLMTGDVILVTHNYRLGPLGFLSTGDSEVPGNNGLKDQVMALRWVQQNIAHFGGDPGNVTIFGESAGGASVHHQMLSPMSKGLFQRAISQSGSALNPWVFSDSTIARRKAFKLGEVLGCKTTSSKELVEHLREVPVRELVEVVDKALTEEEKHPLPLYFSPTNEAENESGEEIFLPDNPINIIAQERFHKIPFIIGVTGAEGIFLLKDAEQNPEWIESLNENFEPLITTNLNVDKNTDESKFIANKVKKFYFGDEKICKKTWQQYVEFFSDMWFLYGINLAVKMHEAVSQTPIYFYRFAYDGKMGLTDMLFGTDRLPGASHGDDIGYLFHMSHHDKLHLGPEDECIEVSNRMVKMWTNFAKTGNPTPEYDPLLGVTWEAVSKSNYVYLNIDKDLRMKKDLEKERLTFWEDVYSSLIVPVGYCVQKLTPNTNMPETVIVRVTQGDLRGKKQTAKTGATYYSFQGIPYAKPPVGHLRFKAPEPAQPWEGIRDARTEGSVSPQISFKAVDVVFGDEDCLFLNVYTPQLPPNDVLKPVMVYLHGGAFYFGSGNTDMFGPGRLMTGEVILVTTNYRLGALGFLTTGDSVVPGNNGLKDQVMALRWVQQNIAQFGGDPGNVTLFGESAGGSSVQFHLLSPMSKGLFHRAIAQSGSVLNPWAFADSATLFKRVQRFCKALGCEATSSEELVEFLMKVPAEELVLGVNKALTEEEKRPIATLFVPTNETGVHEGEETFLPGLPEYLMAEGKFHSVPFIIGVTTLESIFVLGDISANSELREFLNNKFHVIISMYLNIDENSNKCREISRKVKSFYLGNKPISKETLQEVAEFYSDIFFVSGVYRSAKKHQAKSSAPVYLYKFSFEGNMGISSAWIGPNLLPGASHGDDLGYLFDGTLFEDLHSKADAESKRMSEQLVRTWTTFATTGDPSLGSDKSGSVIWNPVTENEVVYVDIDKEWSMKRDFFKDRMAFWDEIYESL